MIGALIGDIVGSIYEHHSSNGMDFPLFSSRSHMTDDSLMTIAIALALRKSVNHPEQLADNVIEKMRLIGREFPNAGYGGRFGVWLWQDEPTPYNSFGNGSAMRVTPVGWFARSYEEALHLAEITAAVTHNHPEGIKGAQAVGGAVYLARAGKTIPEIRQAMNAFYPLDFRIDDLRGNYRFSSSCQGSVPVALEAFLEGESFEDVLRLAISVGGDSDTIAAMACGIADAFYGVPASLRAEALNRFPNEELKQAFLRCEIAAMERQIDQEIQ